ncbi:DNA-binding response regulator, LuxR family [Burkholderia ambifaria MEX-5]|uniref:DNA-binding response regulator, LuxR family n=1 Tax=Burkholderia ambifaria MEX-5 TaxID=396597 RepID=B1TDG2_9BURK|nr:DNA-binding response regulator, LuxR family [Burkholderia ambifaria MEX-5]
MAPRRRVERLQNVRPRARPRRGPVGRERIEIVAEREIARERGDQPRAFALAVADRKAGEREQRIAPLTIDGRRAEHVQPVANLRFLQFAQPCVDAREQRVLVPGVARRRHAQLVMQPVFGDRREDRLAQQLRAPRIDHQRFVVFVDLPFEILQRAVVFRARERRHQVIDDHGLRAALRLAALARIVDDERIQVRQRPERQVRPARVGQRDALARQPFEVAVLAEVDDRVDAERIAQPEIEREVRVRRHEVRVVVARIVVLAARTRRLDADEHVARAPAGDREAPLAQRRVRVGRPPALVQRLAHGSR